MISMASSNIFHNVYSQHWFPHLLVSFFNSGTFVLMKLDYVKNPCPTESCKLQQKIFTPHRPHFRAMFFAPPKVTGNTKCCWKHYCARIFLAKIAKLLWARNSHKEFAFGENCDGCFPNTLWPKHGFLDNKKVNNYCLHFSCFLPWQTWPLTAIK